MNNNLQKIQISGIRKFFNKVSTIPDAVSLTLGQPDFPVPDRIKIAMIEAIRENKTVYTPNAGLTELRTAISNYLRTMDISYEPDEVCITVGGSEGLFAVFNTLINAGDKVIVPNPSYPAYESIVKLLGGQVIDCTLTEDFNLNIPELKRIIKEQKPKILVLSYPSNPTGAGLSRENRDELYNIIKENDITVVTDEIYSALYFEEQYYSVAQFYDIRDKVILVSGFSKMFSMTGLRLGYVCAPSVYMQQILKVHQYNVSCAPSIVQWGVLEGLQHNLEDVSFMKEQFMLRRDYVYSRLCQMGIHVVLPKGAFYIFPSIEQFNMKSEEFCDKLLQEKKVAFVPGSAFGTRGDNFMRISYSYSREQLELALNRLEDWLPSLR
jgi:aminotransferase